MALISVIIPTYNRANLISRAITSVINQTFNDYEIIVVDDNSTDNTEELVKTKFKNKVIYFKHDINLGPAAARNTGIKNSTGEYIAFLDSDDEWLPTKLEKQLNAFLNLSPDYGLIYVRSLIDRNGKLVPYLPFEWLPKKEGDLFESLLRLNFIDTPAVMIKRTVFEEVGYFDETLKCVEDYELFLRISSKFLIKHVDEFLLISHLYDDGINMRSIELHASVLDEIIQRYIGYYDSHQQLYSDRLMIIGDLYYKSGNKTDAIKYFKEGLKKNRLNIKCTLLLVFAKISLVAGLEFYDFVRTWIIRFNRIFTGKGGLH